MSELNDRIVPVTRKRLRARPSVPTWTEMLANSIDSASLEERAAAVRALIAAGPRPEDGALLARIAREEEGDLRLLAFRSLIAQRYPEGRDIFSEAVRSGSDAERSLAIDGLARLGAFEALTEAFSDRVEPLAAKAALLYSAAHDRRTLLEALDERIEPTRRDAILKLLVGVLE
jgi:signal transduction histidine kinase